MYSITTKILDNYILHNLGDMICSYACHTVDLSYSSKNYNIYISDNTLKNIINKTIIQHYDFNTCDVSLYIKYGTYINITFCGLSTGIKYIQTDYIIGLINGTLHFAHQSKLQYIPKNIDTRGVTNMSMLFIHATFFNCDLNRWDTSHVTDMSDMFNGALSFNGNIDKFNTLNVVNMACMFYNAHCFNRNIDGWNIKNVNNMRNMFTNSYRFNCMYPNGNLNNWDISRVIYKEGMFRNVDKMIINSISSWNINYVDVGLYDLSYVYVD